MANDSRFNTFSNSLAAVLLTVTDGNDTPAVLFKNCVNGFDYPEKTAPNKMPFVCIFFSDGTYEGELYPESPVVVCEIIGYFKDDSPQNAQERILNIEERLRRSILSQKCQWENEGFAIQFGSFGFGDVLRRNFNIAEIQIMPPFYGVHISITVKLLY